jgi:integrase/recombinase XerC
LYSIVKKHGDTAGVDVRPHGLRHTAITSALENTNGDIRKTQKFARLRDVNSVLVYDDCREDVAGQVAELVSGAGK